MAQELIFDAPKHDNMHQWRSMAWTLIITEIVKIQSLWLAQDPIWSHWVTQKKKRRKIRKQLKEFHILALNEDMQILVKEKD